MPSITENQLLGNQGEALVSYLLSKFCLVRPVAGGTDVGIDLYCETITDDQPNNNFLVQVKAAGSTENSHNFPKDKIEYWWRQTLPAFVFLVSPEINYEDQKFTINVINLTECYLQDSEIKHDTKTLKSDFTIKSLASMQKFIHEIVPVSAARLWLKHGIIVPARPGIQLGYLKHYPAVGCSKYADKSLKFIGRSASMLLIDLIKSDQSLNEDSKRYRDHLEKILETFHYYGNYDMHYGIGLSKFLSGRKRESIDHLKKALDCFERDKRIDKAMFQPILDEIQKMISKAEQETSV